MEELSKTRGGQTRAALAGRNGIPDGKDLTRCLEELLQCGFIRKYQDFTKEKNGAFYQLMDPLSLFHLTFLKNGRAESWLDFFGTPAYYAWCGLAFEKVCLWHAKQIKNALGIAGVSSQFYAWKSSKTVPGAQIDLLIDRRDEVVNICEIKYSAEEYVITSAYEKELLHKIEAFRNETGSRKALFLTMITTMGVKKNAHKEIVVNEVTGEDLFR